MSLGLRNVKAAPENGDVGANCGESYDGFERKSGALVLAEIPYKLERPLVDGICDLRRLTESASSENLWVFDAPSKTWYSLGGTTQIEQDRVMHLSYLWDLSLLSETPQMYHIHPDKCVAELLGESIHIARQHGLVAFLSTVPSSVDYEGVANFLAVMERIVETRSFVVSQYGVAEFKYRQGDRKGLKAVASRFDKAGRKILREHRRAHDSTRADEEAVAEELFRRLSAELPDDFEIKYEPFERRREYLRKD